MKGDGWAAPQQYEYTCMARACPKWYAEKKKEKCKVNAAAEV